MTGNRGVVRPWALLAGAAAAGLALTSSEAVAQSAEQQVRELRRQLQEQQRLMEQMRRQMDVQQRQMQQLLDGSRKAAEDSAAARAAAEASQREVGELAKKPLISSTSPDLKVALSGQLSRLLNFADDSHSSKFYFVDNDISVSRLRFTATGQVTGDFSIGTNIELAISPNNSAQVSQINEEGSQRDEFRKTEGIFKSNDYGTISFGKGDPATKDITRIDLSGTDILAYASTGDLAGGLLFRDDDEDLSDVDVNDGFTDFDSGRQNRIRYDTPKYSGFTASASGSSDQRWGTALRWAGTGYGVKAAAGAGVQDPSENGVDEVYSGSASVLHEATGLNLTLASALQDRGDANGQLYWGKGGWIHDFFTFGSSAFSIDYGRHINAPASDSDGHTVGLVALQNIDQYGTELFAGFRFYNLDQADDIDLEPIYVGTVGTRVKF
jgi:TolA-binding protein